MSSWQPLDSAVEATTSVLGWAVTIVLLILSAFCCGYWIGHDEITPIAQTGKAMAWLPVVWLGRPWMIFPYIVAMLAFYLPLRFESAWLYITAAIVTFVAWVATVAHEVVATSQGKFWRW